MKLSEFRAFLSQFLDVNIYPSFVPEKVSLPAVSYMAFPTPSHSRDMSGSKNGAVYTWRVKIVSNNYQQAEGLKEKLDGLDNQIIGKLGRVFVVYSHLLPKENNSNLINAIVDLRIYQ